MESLSQNTNADAIKPTIAKYARPDKFRIVFKSDLYLADTITSLNLNLANHEIIFTATETADYKWTSWLIDVPKEETVTLFLLDSDDKTRCILVMENAYVFEHQCQLKNFVNAFGIESPNQLEHKVTIQFTQIERLKQTKKGVLSVANKE